MEMQESTIRLMTRLAVEHGAINLSQGFPDEPPAPGMVWGGIAALLGGTNEGIKRLDELTLGELCGEYYQHPSEIAHFTFRQIIEKLQVSRDEFNQYSFPYGIPELRKAISRYTSRFSGFTPNPESELTVVLGATEGLATVLRAVCEPGDEVVVFQPFHEMYPSQAALFGLKPIYVTLYEDRDRCLWSFDRDEMQSKIGENTQAIILNTPHNPTGKVFTKEELEFISRICLDRDVYVITDEIYEHMLYADCQHFCVAALPGMRQRTFVVNSVSKMGSATGWRVGWVISPSEYTSRIRGVHDTLVIQAPTPLQKGAVGLLELGDTFFANIRFDYTPKRDLLIAGLERAGFHITPPQGSYYLFADYREVADLRDLSPVEAAKYLIEEVGVATVPGDSFYAKGDGGNGYLRLAFCKNIETLKEATARLSKLVK
jgi:aspartate/methionine/tyrosine aminotransferase